MNRWLISPAFLFLVLLALIGCGGSDNDNDTNSDHSDNNTPSTPGNPTTLSRVSGNNQTASPGNALSAPLIVKVTDANNIGVSNINVEFFTEGGAGFNGGMITSTVTTGSDGTASINFTLGSSPRIYNVLARVPTMNNASISFNATADAGSDPALLATINIGDLSQGVSVNPVTNKIYVGNNGNKNGCDFLIMDNVSSNTITVINGSDYSTATVTVDNSPIYATPNSNNNRIYVANSGGGSVSILNGNDNSTITTLPNMGAVHQVAIDTDNNEV